ncbi:MAG: metallophosphoesterase [Oscillospiraceae bacterium]|nr:metallophosphoesterase [Oscillospiraceae bacterium]
MSIKILHAADFHLDSAFAAMTGEQAKLRRRESRRLLERLSNYVNQNDVQLVLLAGDLFDGAVTYRETVEALVDALGGMRARVFIAPGNHDFYSARSPYATLAWPENVHIFKTRDIERVELPELGCAVYGAAFTDASQERGLLDGFTAPDDGLLRLMVLHGDMNAAEARYNPVTREQIAASNLDYLALGHTHQFGGVLTAGKTAYAYSGCPEGRGFDETGDKGVLCGSAERGKVDIKFVPFAKRRYEVLFADVTDKTPAEALQSVMPETAASDLCRVIFTGATDEHGIDIKSIEERFAPDFFHLELRDETHIREDVWARAQEDSLRGLFLRELRTKYDASDEDGRARVERAARFGLAALDRRDV